MVGDRILARNNQTIIMARRAKLTVRKKSDFLDILRSQRAAGALPNVSKAAQLIGISRRSLYDRKAADKVFSDQWDEIVEAAYEELEEEAHRRAKGYEREIVYQGKVTGTVKDHSDLLTIFLLKGRYQKYKDSQPQTHVDNRGGSLVLNFGAKESGVEANSIQRSSQAKKNWRGRVYEQSPGGMGSNDALEYKKPDD